MSDTADDGLSSGADKRPAIPGMVSAALLMGEAIGNSNHAEGRVAPSPAEIPVPSQSWVAECPVQRLPGRAWEPALPALPARQVVQFCPTTSGASRALQLKSWLIWCGFNDVFGGRGHLYLWLLRHLNQLDWRRFSWDDRNRLLGPDPLTREAGQDPCCRRRRGCLARIRDKAPCSGWCCLYLHHRRRRNNISLEG
jgi:hypothetical protein